MDLSGCKIKAEKTKKTIDNDRFIESTYNAIHLRWFQLIADILNSDDISK